MPGCGYICPSCNDSGVDENGKECQWCKTAEGQDDLKTPIDKTDDKADSPMSDQEWLDKVHNGSCCWDDNDYDDKNEKE